jgi:hypothetical protein
MVRKTIKVDWSSDFISAVVKRAMGFGGKQKFEVLPNMSVGEQRVIQEGNRVLFGV